MQNNSDYQQYVNTTNWLITSLNNNATYLNYTNSNSPGASPRVI